MSMKEAIWPIFIAAPFISPRTRGHLQRGLQVACLEPLLAPSRRSGRRWPPRCRRSGSPGRRSPCRASPSARSGPAGSARLLLGLGRLCRARRPRSARRALRPARPVASLSRSLPMVSLFSILAPERTRPIGGRVRTSQHGTGRATLKVSPRDDVRLARHAAACAATASCPASSTGRAARRAPSRSPSASSAPSSPRARRCSTSRSTAPRPSRS